MKIYKTTIAFIIVACLMIYVSFEVSENDLVYAVDNVSNVSQSLKDVTASDVGRGAAHLMVDVGGNTTKEIYNYIIDEAGSSKATYGADLIVSNFGDIFGLGNSFESIIDSLMRAIKSKI